MKQDVAPVSVMSAFLKSAHMLSPGSSTTHGPVEMVAGSTGQVLRDRPKISANILNYCGKIHISQPSNLKFLRSGESIHVIV
jgi:hypothetical protein